MKPFRARGYDLILSHGPSAGLWEGIWVESADGGAEPRAGSVGDLLDLDPAWRADVLLGARGFREIRLRMGAFRPVIGWCLLDAALIPPDFPGGRWRAAPTGRPPEAVLLRVLAERPVRETAEGALCLARGAAGSLWRLDPGGRIRLEVVEVLWVPPGPPIVRRDPLNLKEGGT